MTRKGTVQADFSIGSTKLAGTSKLFEEMGELAQVLGKAMATDGAWEHWDGTNLHHRLRDEIGDVRAALDFFILHNFTEDVRMEIEVRRIEKLEKFEAWHRETLAHAATVQRTPVGSHHDRKAAQYRKRIAALEKALRGVLRAMRTWGDIEDGIPPYDESGTPIAAFYKRARKVLKSAFVATDIARDTLLNTLLREANKLSLMRDEWMDEGRDLEDEEMPEEAVEQVDAVCNAVNELWRYDQQMKLAPKGKR